MNERIEFAIGLISLTFFTGWSASRKAPGSQNPAMETTSRIIIKARDFDCIRVDVVLFEPDPVAMLIVFLGKFTILILAGLQVEIWWLNSTRAIRQFFFLKALQKRQSKVINVDIQIVKNFGNRSPSILFFLNQGQ